MTRTFPEEPCPFKLKKLKASQGWFESFKTRANLINVAFKGESVNVDVAAANKFKSKLKVIIQVLNVDCIDVYRIIYK